MINFGNNQKGFPSDRLQLWLALAPFFLSLAITTAIVLSFKYLPPKLPLFYSLPWGENQLASGQQFLIIPGSITAITLINLVISWQLHPSQHFFKKALIISSAIISLIFAITFVKIIFLFI